MLDSYRIIRRPLVTEKAMHRVETNREYAFEVDAKANKVEIRKAVEQLFSVRVVTVRTSIKKGRARRVGYHLTHTSSVKKAIVQLAEGDRIDLL
jgi:large subunit ribosomal protein L23